jgi:hypothetical protein
LPNSTCQVELLYLAFLTAMVVSFFIFRSKHTHIICPTSVPRHCKGLVFMHKVSHHSL